MTFDRPHLRIYINGVLRNEALVDSLIFINNDPVHMATPAAIIAVTRWFHGFLDDARIYNRALSASEIRAIFNATRPR